MKKVLLLLGVILLISQTASAQCYNLDTCWTRQVNIFGSDDHLWDMKVSQTTGSVYATGAFGTIASDCGTVKYNSDGVFQWYRGYDGGASQEDIGHSIAIDDSDNVYVAGECATVAGGKDYVIIKYNSAGTLQWVKNYDGTAAGATDFAYSIFVDASHNVYVTGEGNIAGNGKDYVTLKYTSGGNFLWEARYDGGTVHDIPAKIVVDNSGNVYVTGESRRSGQGNNYLTVKYNSSGVQQWAAAYNGPTNDDDEASDIYVDASGNVYVTGRSINGTAANRDYATIKYNSSGVQQWAMRYDGGISATDEGHSIYVDNSGNVYVTGASESVAALDYLTIKYNSSGTVQWSKRYNGSSGLDDIARKIMPGNGGKIYVGGASNGSGTGDDFVVIEYEMSSGNQCFVERTSIGAFQDNIYAIDMDLVRNVAYAAGETTGGGGTIDGLIARYCILGLVTTTYNIKAVIEGFYNSSTNRMSIKDTIRMSLAQTFSPYTIVETAKSILDSSTLTATHTFYNAQSGFYYLVINHRNAIETWSRAPGEQFTCGSVMNFDFTNAVNKAYGSNQKQVDTSPVRYAIYSGDVNQDDIVDLTDIVLCYNDAFFFLSGYLNTDLTGDYFTDLSDITIAYNNANEFVTVVKP